MYDKTDATMRLTATVPIRRTETVETPREKKRGDKPVTRDVVRVTRAETFTAKATQTIEGAEAVAEKLYELLTSKDRVILDSIFGDAGENYKDDVVLRDDASVDIQLSKNTLPVVFLAARKKAKDASKENMTRSVYSTERVLVAWATGDGFSYPGEDDMLSLPRDFQRAAERALFTFLADQTTGGEIDTDAIPDRDDWMEYSRDMDSL